MHGNRARATSLSTPAAPIAPAPEPASEYKQRVRPDGTVAFEAWLADGLFHRIDGPAAVWYHPEGTVECEEWYVGGERHRTDGPAYVQYRPDGTVEWEEWWVGGVSHRIDGPPYVRYYPDGTVEAETWLAEGKRHRDDGPARVLYHPDGTVESETWYVDNTEVESWQVLGRYLLTRGVSGLSAEALKQITKDVPWQRWDELGPDHPLVALWNTVHPTADASAG